MARGPAKVVFVCVHNAGRSQMAEALFGHLADPKRAIAVSAGTDPGMRVHPEVVAVMKEYGIDLSRTRPRILTDEITRHSKVVVTMGCSDHCPHVEHAKMEDWPLSDPAGQSIDAVRKIRDDILRRVQALIEREHWGKPAPAAGTAAAGGAKPAAGTTGPTST